MLFVDDAQKADHPEDEGHTEAREAAHEGQH
jgi:hypothetical protein